MTERIEALRRAVQYGLASGKRNMIVELDLLAALLHIGEPIHCEHGVPDGEWCLACHDEYKRTRTEADQ